MNFLRPSRLTSVFVCLCTLFSVPAAWSQTPPPKPAPAQAPPAVQTPPKETPQRKANPFENVPQATEPAPKPQTNQNVIEEIQFRGARRVPQDTLRQMIVTKKGDIYDPDVLRRDFTALWNTGRFDDIRLEAEPAEHGGLIIRFVVTERSMIRTIKYEGAKSLTQSEILDRFKERKVGLSVEQQYDPNKIQRAAVVLKELLAERGRQFATVDPELRRIPPSSLEVIFNVNEGPKVKVGKITILGNEVFSSREVIRAMKNLHPIGIPHSILLENLFDRTFDASKLEEDKERIRDAYTQKGYWMAKVLDQKVTLRDVGGTGTHIWLIKPNKPGKRADITLPLEEGHQYRLNKISYVGVKLFRTPEALSKQIFQMDAGDVFSTTKLRKGLENLRKLYGDFGYIDFVPEPAIDVVPNADKIDLTLTADEGKQFFVRRIDFVGNTTTRDKVIRREILLDEGDMYSTRMWDASILRLNQLGYFEVLKENESYTLTRNPQTNTVDITLKVKERGKNSIGLNGGVSGIAGSFVGFNYSTNNFLGLGETLSLESQLGTRMRDVSLGFTEPYFLDRPLQAGFVVYLRRFDFNQGREISLLSGQNYIPYFNALGTDNLLNYIQNSKGASVSLSYPIKRSFARIGITYGFDDSNIVTKTTASTNYFEFINFQGVNGPNSLSGIKTSRIVPSYTYNSKNHPISPTAGKSIYFATEFAGSFLGGNVNTIRPSADFQYFHFSPVNHKHTLAFHFMGSLLTGYGGKVAPPFSRTFMGGEQDVRGFEFFSITPIAYVASSTTVNVLNNDGTPRTQKTLVNGVETQTNVTMNVPIYQTITPGGDTQLLSNFEYRIPIIGPVILAPFYDIGLNRIFLTNQLKMNPDRVAQLNQLYPQAAFDGKVRVAAGTQKIRMSTGIELQVMLPVVQAPFRIYWAYNPSIVHQYLQPPIVADRSAFPNNATFLNSIATFGNATPFFEKRSTFRFTIGRTF